MKVKKKAKWIRKAMKEFREYEERVVEFKAGRDLKKLLEFVKNSLWQEALSHKIKEDLCALRDMALCVCQLMEAIGRTGRNLVV
jgi:hypothetical protein